MHVRSTGEPRGRATRRLLAVALVVGAPALLSAQAPVPEPVPTRRYFTDVERAFSAWQRVASSLALELTPWALGDSLGGARLGLQSGISEDIAAVGIDWRFRGAQLSASVASPSGFQNLADHWGRSFALSAGRPLLQGTPTSRLGWSVGAVGSLGYQPKAGRYPVSTLGATVGVPAAVRLRLTSPPEGAEARRSPWRPAPTLALYAAPTLAYGVAPAAEVRFLDDTTRFERAAAVHPQLQLGARLEGIGPLRLHVAWRHSPRGGDWWRDSFAIGAGLAIR